LIDNKTDDVFVLCDSTAAMFLRPAMREAGNQLNVLTDSLVTRVTFDKQQATGIEYVTNGQIKRAFASREVVFVTLLHVVVLYFVS